MRIHITDPEKKKFYLIRNMPLLTDLWPMRIRYMPTSEIKDRKKANNALKIFYLSLITTFTLAPLVKFSNSTDTRYHVNYNSYDSTKPITDSEKAQILDSFKKDLQRTKNP